MAGEGTLPLLEVLEPSEVTRQQEPLLHFLSTRLGDSAAGTIRLRNSGLVECMVRVGEGERERERARERDRHHPAQELGTGGVHGEREGGRERERERERVGVGQGIRTRVTFA